MTSNASPPERQPWQGRELVEFIARGIVERPEAVEVLEREDDRGLVLEVRVASEDMGKVIGRRGRVVRALRTVAKAAALRSGKRVSVEIVQA